MSAPVVLLDACTLYPAALRDVLMRLALHGLIAARWTNKIHDEWIGAVLRDRPDLSRARLQRTRDLMDLHAEGSLGILREARLSLKQPPLAAVEYLETLHAQGLARACALLAPFLHEL